MAEKLGGSSPLTRGKHAVSATILQVRGLIPAHAGKTASHRAARRRRAAHPRSRGENVSCGFARSIMSGSSPLTRGKLDALPVSETEGRLIPAHAGKTSRLVGHAPTLGAHPRSRGENKGPLRVLRHRTGSSPLTRGKRRDQRLRRVRRRLIPAHAGKTDLQDRRTAIARAHPRSRGENLRVRRGSSPLQGSSPLTRGKLYRLFVHLLVLRLIPAHAGKTAPNPLVAHILQAHPRSRGENAVHRRAMHRG